MSKQTQWISYVGAVVGGTHSEEYHLACRVWGQGLCLKNDGMGKSGSRGGNKDPAWLPWRRGSEWES